MTREETTQSAAAQAQAEWACLTLSRPELRSYEMTRTITLSDGRQLHYASDEAYEAAEDWYNDTAKAAVVDYCAACGVPLHGSDGQLIEDWADIAMHTWATAPKPTRFWISHRDDSGQLHSIGDEPWLADTAEEALAEMLRQAGAEDDGRYKVTPA